MITGLLITYFVALFALAAIGVHRLFLTWCARRASVQPAPAVEAWPDLLVQLPVYNEAFVVERLLRAADRLEYPGRKRIQVLDDSTDETRAIVLRTVNRLRQAGAEIEVVHRAQRDGFKAGALAVGLRTTDEPLVAIFDADFVPHPDFLLRVVPRLVGEPTIGMVQARWGHLNRDASLLTRAQAIFLDGHFAIEHQGRAACGHMFNFNGTAGVWRRAAIDDAGGWQADTITEDLDLSYRSQLAGWKFAYEDAVVAPAELPDSWGAFRAQQARWVRGSIQTARKLLGQILRAQMPLSHRLDAVLHLTNNIAYLLIALLAVLLPAAVMLRDVAGWRVPGGRMLLTGFDMTTLVTGTGAMLVFYLSAVRRTTGRLSVRRTLDVLFALCVGAGMCVSNSVEVLRGLWMQDCEFVRTPKRGDAPLAMMLRRYAGRQRAFAFTVELGLLCYFTGAVIYVLYNQLFAALPFLLLYWVGFFAVVRGAIAEGLAGLRRRPQWAQRSEPA